LSPPRRQAMLRYSKLSKWLKFEGFMNLEV
jgi:hypothetical protein